MSANNNFDMKSQLENTLNLNSQMQNKLLMMREKLERLLSNVKDTYEANDVLLKDGVLRTRTKGFGMKGAYLRGGTFYLKGNMFFRDIKCRSCPNNQDYENRKKGGEMFPMDFNLKARHVWSTADKQGIILGIKEQIIDYLTQPSKRRCKKSKEIDSEKLAKLLNMIPADFRIDWDYISSCNLSHRHTAKNCEAIWNLFLHPSLNRSAWSEKENHKLLEAAKKFNFQNWQIIAKEVGQRSDFQCFVQYKNVVCHMLPESYTKWTKEDDKRLLDAISRNTVNGNINWSNVNAYFPHKAKTTLHSRYNFSLNPNITRGASFTPEEDVLLIAAVKEYGKFSCIPRSLFPNRNLVQLRSHYKYVLTKRHSHQPWTLEDDIKLMDIVSENGTKAWSDCEKMFDGRHTRQGCRTRYLTIKRYLSRNPDSTIETLPRKKFQPKNSVNIQNWKEKVDELSLNKNVVSNNVENLNNRTVRKSTKKGEKPYFVQLKTHDRGCYNFFKYAYNFQLNRHPCQNVHIKNEDFAIVLSALNPLYSKEPMYDLTSGIPQFVKQDIIRSSTLPSCKAVQLLPPSWCTAMGFRALCINTTDISTNLQSDEFADNTNNDHIRRFRERLRRIFYSTVLLSRLNPAMVGIVTSGVQPMESRILKRKRRNLSKSGVAEKGKTKTVTLNKDVKTEIET